MNGMVQMWMTKTICKYFFLFTLIVFSDFSLTVFSSYYRNIEEALNDFSSPVFDEPFNSNNDSFIYNNVEGAESRNYDTFIQRVASLKMNDAETASKKAQYSSKVKRSFSTSSYTASNKPNTVSHHKSGKNPYISQHSNGAGGASHASKSSFSKSEIGINDRHDDVYYFDGIDNNLHSFHQNNFSPFNANNANDYSTDVGHLNPFKSDETLDSSSKNLSPWITSSKQKRSSALVSSEIPPRRLTFLENLESIPTEADIFALRALSTSIKAGVVDQTMLMTALSSFGSLFEDISLRANYWGWAPKYFSFIYKILQGSHGPISNIAVLSYCSALLSYLACLMTRFDFDREPSIQRYFIKKALPRLVEITGKYNTKFDTPSLAMMYICFHLNVDEHLVGFLMDLRFNIPNFFSSSKNKILRYRRAFWFASVCNRLLIQNDLNGGSAIANQMLFQCISEAQASYSQEYELIIKSAYNKFFYFNDKK